jgi:hypothetical protein
MMRRLLAPLVVALAVALPRLARACPVCMAADARRMDAYVATTVLLSLLPLAAIGGIAWLVWRRSAAAAYPPLKGAALEGAAPAAPDRAATH